MLKQQSCTTPRLALQLSEQVAYARQLAVGWLHGTVVKTLVFDRQTFLSHARPAADG